MPHTDEDTYIANAVASLEVEPLAVRAARHRRWAVILETAGEASLALEHFGRAMRLQSAADERDYAA